MNGNLKVKDRATFEQGRLFQCLQNGWVKVLMDSGEVRKYQPRDLIGTLESGESGNRHNTAGLKTSDKSASANH